MRRAAEAGARRNLDVTTDGQAVVAREVGVSTDAFLPEETPESRRLWPVEASSPGQRVAREAATVDAQAKPSTSALLPPLAERLDAKLEHKVVVDAEMDPVSREQYRRLAAGLHAAQAASGLKVILIASALASEGKTLTTSNLALTFSESYQRTVLLIDGDLRRPSVHQVFGLPRDPGLCEGLSAPADRKLPLHQVSPRLTVLTAGDVSTGDPMGALTSDRMHRVIQEARDAFDWVIVDTPPIGLISDASLLAEFADGVILVVKANATPHELVQRAVAALGKDRILGLVLNRATNPPGGRYKYSYSSYYHSTASGPRQT
jgi:capsular exopolysaccharide synthesis family protein